jgi:hypothetical protein
MNILLAHFNAKVGKEDIFKLTVGNERIDENDNDNGVRVVKFVISKDLVASTMFPHHRIHKYKWTSSVRKRDNQIDHVLMDRRRQSSILDV